MDGNFPVPGDSGEDENARKRPHFPFGPFAGDVGYLHELRHDLPENLDRTFHAMVAKATGGFSPISFIGSYLDWGTHLLFSPGKQMQIGLKAWDKGRRLFAYADYALGAGTTETRCIEPLVQDKRFHDDAWTQFPFNLIHQQFLLTQQWWHNVFTEVPGVRPQHEAIVDFTSRQFLDVFAPSNFFFTNPEVLHETIDEGGANLWRGAVYLCDDVLRDFSGRRSADIDGFKVGENLAITPGKVVFRNHLIELIQYEPTTQTVKKPPVLIIPAWIMKYYILDLSADNSLVKYLVDQGHTVFIASWRNPSAEDRDLGFDDYIQMGALDAIEAVRGLTEESQLHLCGYCLGGTLASIAAAALARKADNPLLSLTLLAAQVDFREAGELSLFISDSQLALLEDLMWDQGYLDKNQMGGAFQILRSNDLVWSRMLHRYWEGERSPAFDLMAWNADGTRMPYRMHSEYLRSLYLENDLAEGRFEVDGEVISISDINVPIFAVSTDHDHVAPWHSVYKIHILGDTETIFVLTTGGHNAGIVSEPGHKGRSFKIARTDHGTPFIPPDVWEKRAEEKEGSWWIDWEAWLSKQSDETCPAREPHLSERTDNMLIRTIKAPGTYVHQQ